MAEIIYHKEKLVFALFSLLLFLPALFSGGKDIKAQVIFFILLFPLAFFVWKMNDRFEVSAAKLTFALAAAFVLLAGISAIYSPQHYQALLGFFNLLACLILALLVFNFADSPLKLKYFGYIILALGAVLSLIGIYDFVLSQNYQSLRLVSTFYSQIPFSEFLIYPFFIALCLLFLSRPAKKERNILIVLNILFGVTLFFTHCRGAGVSFALVLLFLVVFFKKEIINKKSLAFLAAIVIPGVFSIAVIMQVKSWQAHRDSAPAAVYNGPETIQENAVSARLLFWQRAWDIFKDRPLTGGGLASYPELHKQYLQPPFYYSADPHNLYLKILAELGIVAFLVFIGFIASFLRRFLTFTNHLRKTGVAGKDKSSVISLAIMAGIVSALIGNGVGFGWDFPADLIIFFFSLGLALKACAIYSGAVPANPERKIGLIVFPGAAFLFFFAPIIFFADNNFQDYQYYLQEKDENNALAVLRQARQINPFNPQYSALLASFDLSSGRLDQAQAEISHALTWSDTNPNLLLQGRIYLAQNRPDLAQAKFKEAIEKYPSGLAAYTVLSVFYQDRNRFSEIPPLLAEVLPLYKKEYILSPLYIASDKNSILNQISALYSINANAYAKLGNDGEAQIQLNAAAEYAQ